MSAFFLAKRFFALITVTLEEGGNLLPYIVPFLSSFCLDLISFYCFECSVIFCINHEIVGTLNMWIAHILLFVRSSRLKTKWIFLAFCLLFAMIIHTIHIMRHSTKCLWNWISSMNSTLQSSFVWKFDSCVSFFSLSFLMESGTYIGTSCYKVGTKLA